MPQITATTMTPFPVALPLITSGWVYRWLAEEPKKKRARELFDSRVRRAFHFKVGLQATARRRECVRSRSGDLSPGRRSRHPPDKPDITLDVPNPDTPVSSFLNVRVADIEATRTRLRKHGIEFLTDPWDRQAEIRAYVRDPVDT